MAEGVKPRDWDAATYTAIAAPQFRWAGPVVDRLGLRGDETVLDAGCGSGRVTATLLDRVPDGRVIAIDASPSMLAEARKNLAEYGPRVTIVEADLQLPLPVAEPVDAVFSTATFHWIPDHETLFRNLFAVMRPGGRLSRPVWRRRQRRERRSRPHPDRRRLARPLELRDPRGDRGPPGGGRFRRRRTHGSIPNPRTSTPATSSRRSCALRSSARISTAFRRPNTTRSSAPSSTSSLSTPSTTSASTSTPAAPSDGFSERFGPEGGTESCREREQPATQRVTITDEPWPNRPWLIDRPTRAPSTWRSPASPRSCHVSSQTWAIACAGMASPKQARPPLGFTGMRPPSEVAPECSSASASPGAHRPMFSYQSSSSAVDRS